MSSLIETYHRGLLKNSLDKVDLVFADMGFEIGKAYAPIFSKGKVRRDGRFFFIYKGVMYKGLIQISHNRFCYIYSSIDSHYLRNELPPISEADNSWFYPTNCIYVEKAEESINYFLGKEFISLDVTDLLSDARQYEFIKICEMHGMKPLDLNNWYDVILRYTSNKHNFKYLDSSLAFHPSL